MTRAEPTNAPKAEDTVDMMTPIMINAGDHAQS